MPKKGIQPNVPSIQAANLKDAQHQQASPYKILRNHAPKSEVFGTRLRASVNRLATFRTWPLSE